MLILAFLTKLIFYPECRILRVLKQCVDTDFTGFKLKVLRIAKRSNSVDFCAKTNLNPFSADVMTGILNVLISDLFIKNCCYFGEIFESSQ